MQINLSGNALCGIACAKAIVESISVSPSLTSVALLGNSFDDATVEMLLKLKEEKPSLISLCGLALDQTEANFKDMKLRPADARLLAPEIIVRPSVTCLDVRQNSISGDGASQLSAAVLGNLKMKKFNEIPIKEMRTDSLTKLALSGKGVEVVGGMVVAGLLPEQLWPR